MRKFHDRLILSPSDLMRFQACAHATALDLRYARGEPLVPVGDDAGTALIQKKGLEHEAAHLGRYDAAEVVTISHDTPFPAAAAETTAAMRAGAKVIYQGALETGAWQGWSDFLERVERPSALGDFSYAVADTKLKRRAEPKHALQLAIYSRAVAEIQGVAPEFAYVVIGTGERVAVAMAEVSAYAARLAAGLEAFVANPQPTAPDPVDHCGMCRWRDLCDADYDAADSLVRVAGITRSQRRRLVAAGVDTLEKLAAVDAPVRGIAPETFEKLRIQAGLQARRRRGEGPAITLKAAEPGRGFALLPPSAAGDLFFDMEGDPLIVGGREYLFGVFSEADDFRSWWAHDDAAERDATRRVLEYFLERLQADPAAHIYHYNHYEVTALKRLTQRHGVGERILDELLRHRRFVDLYRVVQQGLYASEPGYSLKNLEVFFREKRDGAITNAGDSIVAYETWLEHGDQSILDDIERYNAVDCRSTRDLRDWLIRVRPPEAVFTAEQDTAIDAEQAAEDPERVKLRALLDRARPRLGDRVADLLFELSAFHDRADKPQWWEFYDRRNRSTEELIDDLECLGGLEAVGTVQNGVQDYRFPHQQTKRRVRDQGCLATLKGSLTLVSLDRAGLRVGIKFPRTIKTPPERIDFLPAPPLGNRTLRAGVVATIEAIAADAPETRAIRDFLDRTPPRLAGRDAGEPILAGDDVVAGTIAAVAALDGSCLPIQGPPGTGKTYVSARAIVELAKRGKRVGVTSNAHKAIDNLLVAVAVEARRQGVWIPIAKKISKFAEDIDDPMITPFEREADRPGDALVFGGTARYFVGVSGLDTLFVDEAGQVAVANLVAMGCAARNIVVVGDQMQLPQPVQGVHPGESGLSILDYLLGDARTMPADFGIFLPVSRRMHPAVCGAVSRLAYDGRLSSDAGAARHRIDAPGLPPHGVIFDPVDHADDAQVSEAEAARVRRYFTALVGATFTDRDGVTRTIGVADILVVTPYNAQVNLLAGCLPEGARVGTVDKFQGQEAPVCLISMATSSAEEMPRDVGFLFSLNRLNVAISRAQALAAVIASPRLLDVPCKTLDEMKLVNALCAVAADALPPPQFPEGAR